MSPDNHGMVSRKSKIMRSEFCITNKSHVFSLRFQSFSFLSINTGQICRSEQSSPTHYSVTHIPAFYPCAMQSSPTHNAWQFYRVSLKRKHIKQQEGYSLVRADNVS